MQEQGAPYSQLFFYLRRSESKRIGIQNIRTTSGEYSVQNIRFEAHICQSSSKFYIQANIRLQIFAYKRILASKYSYKPFTNLRLVLGMKKTPVGAGTICTPTHTGILHSSLPEISYSLWSKTFSLLLTGNSVKASKQKMTGKTGGDSPHGEGKSSTYTLS
jgi:hypothetical protein